MTMLDIQKIVEVHVSLDNKRVINTLITTA